MAKSFIFYDSWLQAIELLPSDELRGKAMMTLAKYALRKEEDISCHEAAIILQMAKAQIDINAKRRDNGLRGGNPNKTKREPNCNQTITKHEPNHNQIETNVIEEEKENKEKVIQKENKEIIKEIKENIIEDNVKEKEKNTLFPKTDLIETFSGEERKIAPKERRFVKPTIAEIAAYCRERNNGVEATAFYDFYESKGWKVGNQPMKNWQAAVRTWERQDGRRATSKPQSTTRVELPTDYSKLIPGNHV